MTVAFQNQTKRFENGTGTREETLEFPFTSTVKEACAAVSGFRFDFVDEGTIVNVVEVSARVSRRSGDTVQVKVKLHADDEQRNAQFSDHVDVLAIAEL